MGGPQNLPGQRLKAPDQLVNRRGGRGQTLQVVPRTERRVPPAPRGLSRYARARWRQFWTSDVADAVNAADHERLARWIECIAERDRYWQIVKATPLLMRDGRASRNPLWVVIRQLTDEIERAEAAFGMTPLARFRLQFTRTEAAHSLEDLMAKLSPTARLDALDDSNIIDLDAIDA